MESLRNAGENAKGQSAVPPRIVGTAVKSGKLYVLAQCIPEENVTKAVTSGSIRSLRGIHHFPENRYVTSLSVSRYDC